MNTKPLTLIAMLLFTLNFSIAQISNNYTFRGQVINSMDSSAVSGCKVLLKLNGSNVFETKTDSAGVYRFCVVNEVVKTAEVYTVTDRFTTTPKAKYGFLASDEQATYIIEATTKKTFFYKMFKLQPIVACGNLSLPINFMPHSSEYNTIYDTAYKDSSMCIAANILKLLAKKLLSEPGMVIEIAAHASSDEKFPMELSMLRAEKIYLELINLGVDKDQLKPKAYGVSKMKIGQAEIKKEKTKEGKEAMHACNRRVVFSVVSYP